MDHSTAADVLDVARCLGSTPDMAAGVVAGSATLTIPDDAGGDRPVACERFWAVPSLANARFLVPVAPGAAVAAAMTAYSGLRSPRARFQRAVVGAVARVRLVRLGTEIATVLPANAGLHLLAHLCMQLGVPDVLAGVGVGNLDVHYKPTVQFFSATGRPVGFAKIGWSNATAALVRTEADAMRTAASWVRPPLRVPEVLHVGTYGVPYSVTAPLPTNAVAVPQNDPLPDLARVVAGERYEQPVADSDYFTQLCARAAAVGDKHRPVIAAAIDTLREISQSTHWRFGRWHGDWVPWNIARAGASFFVWDFEHHGDTAPWGFDLLHWQVTVPHLVQGRAYSDCIHDAVRHATLPRQQHRNALILAYLIEMALRSNALVGEEDDLLYPQLFATLEAFTAAERVRAL